MGSIIVRSRKDDSKAYTAQIVIKQGGKIVHREAETFDRRQAANAWIVKRESELKRPGGLVQKEDPTLSAVIDRFIAESKNAVLGTDNGAEMTAKVVRNWLMQVGAKTCSSNQAAPGRTATANPSTENYAMSC